MRGGSWRRKIRRELRFKRGGEDSMYMFARKEKKIFVDTSLALGT